MNTDNRLLTRESSEHIREFFSSVERLSVSMERLFAGRSPAMAGENFYAGIVEVDGKPVMIDNGQQLEYFPLELKLNLTGCLLYTSRCV